MSSDEKKGGLTTAENQNAEAKKRLARLHELYGATWDRPDDPNDPYNWPEWRKVTIGIIFSVGQLAMLMSASILAAALGNISRDLGIGASTAQITLSIYFLGLGVGPFFMAALAEMNGRKHMWIASNAWYILWNSLCPVGESLPLMIVGRFLAATGAGIILTGPVMADMYHAKDRGKSLAIASFLPYLGPALGPIVGGIVVQLLYWPWLFWIVSIFDAAITVLGAIAIEESYTPVLLRRKAAATSGFIAPALSPRQWAFWRDFLSRLLTYFKRPLELLIRRPVVQVISLVLAWNFGAIIMDAIYGRLRDRPKNKGEGRPEFRAPYMVPGVLFIPIGLFWYGWAAEYHITWVMVDIGAIIFTCGSSILSQALLAYTLDIFGDLGASANAATRLLSNVLGFAFPIFAPRLYDRLGYGWGNSLLATDEIDLYNSNMMHFAARPRNVMDRGL
ncbi:hypothetical protein Daesc_004264 [Daldinia eschscholtzii]|uniref:Major facilitator superfamily (MFS) profile domain-containing protein n=1 Tax=Daldinia eschscholtzii TaxID=292717 RepID=A0AAX6MPH2_9PEZI